MWDHLGWTESGYCLNLHVMLVACSSAWDMARAQAAVRAVEEAAVQGGDERPEQAAALPGVSRGAPCAGSLPAAQKGHCHRQVNPCPPKTVILACSSHEAQSTMRASLHPCCLKWGKWCVRTVLSFLHFPRMNALHDWRTVAHAGLLWMSSSRQPSAGQCLMQTAPQQHSRQLRLPSKVRTPRMLVQPPIHNPRYKVHP